MEKTYPTYSQVRVQLADISLVRGIKWGLIGGLAGTIVMDLCVITAFTMAGLSIVDCFSSIGDTAARFFAIFGLEMAGGFPLGVAAQYLIGPAIGASFGAAVTRVDLLRLNSRKRSIGLAALYVEIVGQPLIASMPLLLVWTLAEALLWYGGALVAHLIAGAVLGLVISFGLCPASGART